MRTLTTLAAICMIGAICAAQVVPPRTSGAAHDLDDATQAFHAYVSTTYPANATLIGGAKNLADAADALHTTVHDVNNNNAPVSQIACDHNVTYRAITRMPALDTVRNDPVVQTGWAEINRIFGVLTRGLLQANLSYIVPSVPAHGLDDDATALDKYLQANYSGSQYQLLQAASTAFQVEADSFHSFYHDVQNCRNGKTPNDIPAEYARLANTAANLAMELMRSGVWTSDKQARTMTLDVALKFLRLSATFRAFRYI